jgi:hypothetical protein
MTEINSKRSEMTLMVEGAFAKLSLVLKENVKK